MACGDFVLFYNLVFFLILFCEFSSIFVLIWNEDISVQNEILVAFKEVFLTDGSSDQSSSLSVDQIGNNLIELVQRVHQDPSELTSVEKIIKDIFQRKEIDIGVVHYYWTVVHDIQQAMDQNRADDCFKLGFIFMILSMIYQNSDVVMQDNQLRTIIQAGFHSCVFQHGAFVTLKYTAICIQRSTSFLSRICSLIKSKKKATEWIESSLIASMEDGIRHILMARGCIANSIRDTM